MRQIRTGVFSGSFNPIHIGHLMIANYLCEFGELDEVWFMVSPHNPLKDKSSLWDDNLRLKLVQLSVAGYPKFKVSDLEFGLPRPSFTVVTLDKLHQQYEDREFYLVIGSDNWARFNLWFEHERILEENKILVYPRPGFLVENQVFPANVKLVHSPVIDISSSFIRNSIMEGKDVRYFLPSPIWKYCIHKLGNNVKTPSFNL